MIQCIFPCNDNDIINELRITLEDAIHLFWPTAIISLYSESDYWKIEGNKEIIFKITDFSNILVKDFIRKFEISWNFTGGFPLSDLDEEAVWSQLCHPEEVFLLSIVDWVHIYTWVE